ncbi:MAG: alcohol dehydrogenase catalytic domain-containing protein [Candidatus Latescibacteria bacterium]|nr:alcohol dehydrogenase catalytic domain-containing protein [Candidatus Latescibacterota bacterium]
MRALVLKSPKHLEVMEVPRPKLSAGQALIKVSKCGICGSDIRYFYGENPWAKQTLGRHVDNPPNIIPGHEFVGRVEEVHDPCDAPLIGKRVGICTWIACGRCSFCRNGQENLCDTTKHLGHGQGWGQMDLYPGGMAEYCPVFIGQIHELPENVSDDQATFFDPLTAAIHAVDMGHPKPLERVAILGAGPIGLLIAQVAEVYGAMGTFITDVAAENITVAEQLGIRYPLNISKSPKSIYDLVMEETNRHGVDVAFNTVGTSESILESLKILKRGGTLVLMATKEEEISFPSLLLSGERTLKTSSNAMYTDFPRAIEFVSVGAVKVEPLITHRFSLSDAVKAFEVGCDKGKTGAIKIIIECPL